MNLSTSPLRRLWTALVAGLAVSLVVAGCGTDPDATNAAGHTDGRTVTDVEGRTVDLPDHVDRVILGKGRLMYTTAMLSHDDPLDKVVGWANDLKKSDKDTYELYKDSFPSIADIPDLGALKKNDFNTEKAISLKPQVLIVEQEDFPTVQQTGLDKKLEAIGAKIVVVDFRLHPLENTVTSVDLIGEVLDAQDQAKAFGTFYDKKMDTITDAVADAEEPKTFLWRAAGLLDCCNTFADENLGEMVTAAGGDNLGDLLPGSDGALSPEKVISEQPETIIATGGSWNPGDASEAARVVPYVELGYGADRKTVDKEFAQLADQPGFDQLDAFDEQRVHVLWHQFYDSPYNVFAVEAMAAWIHPELFEDMDPDADFADFHREFLPVDYQGVFFESAHS